MQKKKIIKDIGNSTNKNIIFLHHISVEEKMSAIKS